MTLYHLFSTALLSTCLLVSTHGGPPKAEELIPPAQADLHFRVGGEDETSLLAALGAVAEASGTHFQMDSVTARGLRETAVGFDRDLTVPAEEAWAVIEQALLRAEDHFTRSSSLGGRDLLIRGVGGEVFSLVSFCIESDERAMRRLAEEQRKLTADSNAEGAR